MIKRLGNYNRNNEKYKKQKTNFTFLMHKNYALRMQIHS